ncbi:sensor histidine kinase LiaS [Kordia sp. SMS9]|uniref:ATP-binding protein n=1 Tax=Kordia sp. SMS9 TaxID=2282170 RepID=UPI000E0CFE1A|nr:ATP-binding protein [Kordia sp. SMS9]AXG68368.1 sensor histidine kinase LiaS [Kordia sp. SMS9]
MKLLPTSSFFFCLIFLATIFSCKTEKIEKKITLSPTIKRLDSIVRAKNSIAEYDSAIFYGHQELNAAKKESNKRYIKKSLLRIQSAYKNQEEYDTALLYADKLYEVATTQKDTLYIAWALSRKAFSLKELKRYKLSYENYIDAKNLYQKINKHSKVAQMLLEISTLEKKTGSFGASQISALEGLDYVQNTKHYSTISSLYYNIAVAAKEQGDLITADKRINEAIALAEDSISGKKISEDMRIILYNAKANVFKENEDYTAAITIFKNLLNRYSEKSSKKNEVTIISNLAHTLFLRDGFNQKSDSLLKNALEFYKKSEDTSGLISVYMKLAEIYSNLNRKKALFYTDQVLQQANKLNNKKSFYEAYQQLIKIDATSDNINKYIELEKEIEQEEDLLQTQFANARFDFDEAEREKNIAERKQLISDEKEAKRTLQLFITLLVLMILVVLTFIIYFRIKRRHKIEKVKTVHVTEARISSKVHDELANDLYELMTQLETTNPEKETVLDKLDTIYNQARDISKQIQSIDTNKGFADELSNLFRSFQSDEVNVLLKRYDIEIWKGISSHIKITVYRVLQELLTNMKKHSNAGLVVVSIERKNKQLFIQYIDNGKGFTGKISKNGLLNAENRIRAIKGKLTFDTELHKGCKFSINVPV